MAGDDARVEFVVDGTLRATATTAPYSFGWETAAEAQGVHTLGAVIVGKSGKTVSVPAVAVTIAPPPTAALATPPSATTATTP